MKKKFINTIALEDSMNIKKGRNIKFGGVITICAGLACVVIGELISNKNPFKIHAVNNEAADLIEELDKIWLSQQK